MTAETPDGRDPRREPAALADATSPVVALPPQGLPVPVLVGLALVLALALFLVLDSHRQARQAGAGRTIVHGAMVEAAPPLTLPPPPAAPPVILHPSAPVAATTPLTPIQRPVIQTPPPVSYAIPPGAAFRRVQPVYADDVFAPPRNRGEGSAQRPATSGQGALVLDLTTGKAGDAAADGGADTVNASLIHNRSSVIPQGAIIAAVLETPLNSDRPGLARAIVSQDARGFDGSRVLIPRGSRLIGAFKTEAGPGKRRVLVMWERLIRPDGVAIRIGSPATDATGGTGIAGSVNTHFAERFASAVLQTAMTVGMNVATGDLTRSGSTLFVGVPGQFTAAGQQLVPDTNRPATIKVREGAEIAVLVAHDLDFSGTPAVR
jgi:type IV secretion system protein VirB10